MCAYAYNKAFKSDSQRLAVSLRSSIAKRRSHLNAALNTTLGTWLLHDIIKLLSEFKNAFLKIYD
ncbi:hypothetical protein CGJ24_23590 [Vibrio parahaemolyticus]|nr:hypothetical protein CGJ24_23590 [Vibrio parahaemolyticus]